MNRNIANEVFTMFRNLGLRPGVGLQLHGRIALLVDSSVAVIDI